MNMLFTKQKYFYLHIYIQNKTLKYKIYDELIFITTRVQLHGLQGFYGESLGALCFLKK